MGDGLDSLAMHDMRPEDRRMHELLEEALARLGRIESRLAERDDDDDIRLRALVHVVAWHVGDRAFSASEVVAHSLLPVAPALRAALVACFGAEHQARRLGVALARLVEEDRDLGGVCVRRIGEDRSGAVWQCESADRTLTLALVPPRTAA